MLSFESRKDAQSIFSYVLRFRSAGASPKSDPVALSYVISNRPEILVALCNGYEHKESAIPAGTVLREVLKNDAAAAIILYDDSGNGGNGSKGLTGIQPEVQQSGNGVFWKFFEWIDKGSFEVGADAFTTFRELLTKHKQIVAQYLSTNFDLFFDKYNNILVKSDSYVTKRQSIKLLGEILLDRANYAVMTAYVDRGEHLKICMNLLRDDRKMVQYEGFHVFKVFVANPHKSIAVQKILLINRERLVKFLQHFLEDRTEDEQFIDEREFLIKQINNMPAQPVEPLQKPALLGSQQRTRCEDTSGFVVKWIATEPLAAQSQRSPHAPVARKGIGPMATGQHPQSAPSQMQAQHEGQKLAIELAKRRSRKPTDKNIPEGVESCIIGDGAQRYKDLRDVERKLDAAMMRKRMYIQDSRNSSMKKHRTLRIWVSNTVDDQEWQGDGLVVDAFDFNTNSNASYKVKIEGRLLSDDEDDNEEDDEDDSDDEEDNAKKGITDKKALRPSQNYALSHFFKSMTVDFDKNRSRDGAEPNVEWKKPSLPPNPRSLPPSADFDVLEFKRGGDENQNITINLTRDETPERFTLSPPLAEILDMKEATRAEAVTGIWEYVKVMGLQEDDEKRSFRCDDVLRQIFQRDTGYIPSITDAIIPHLSALPPVSLPYTIRVDQDFHKQPEPTVYDVRVTIDGALRARLHAFNMNPSYAGTLRDISTLNDELSVIIQALSHSKSKHSFLTTLSKDPANYLLKWISSQKRDLEVICGEASRGGGEDVSGEEWRKGGAGSVWGTENVRESVNLMLSSRAR
ncbi:hypothetical protein V502_04494 [Pseudogymnoascus sp. VKM F-4520 (FW-2644)]|nr:hypothetical protein V502_04494 [Pseudogymnoascus sp. VKM F-4520 (FW-2644)]